MSLLNIIRTAAKQTNRFYTQTEYTIGHSIVEVLALTMLSSLYILGRPRNTWPLLSLHARLGIDRGFTILASMNTLNPESSLEAQKIQSIRFYNSRTLYPRP